MNKGRIKVKRASLGKIKRVARIINKEESKNT